MGDIINLRNNESLPVDLDGEHIGYLTPKQAEFLALLNSLTEEDMAAIDAITEKLDEIEGRKPS